MSRNTRVIKPRFWLLVIIVLFAATAEHFRRSGSAIAGWSGARDMGERLARKEKRRKRWAKIMGKEKAAG